MTYRLVGKYENGVEVKTSSDKKLYENFEMPSAPLSSGETGKRRRPRNKTILKVSRAMSMPQSEEFPFV